MADGNASAAPRARRSRELATALAHGWRSKLSCAGDRAQPGLVVALVSRLVTSRCGTLCFHRSRPHVCMCLLNNMLPASLSASRSFKVMKARVQSRPVALFGLCEDRASARRLSDRLRVPDHRHRSSQPGQAHSVPPRRNVTDLVSINGHENRPGMRRRLAQGRCERGPTIEDTPCDKPPAPLARR